VFQGKSTGTATHPAGQALTATDGTFNKVDVDNIRIDGNTISSTDTNGDITLDPDGTGGITQGSGTFTVKNADGDSNGLKILQDTSDTSKIINHYNGPMIFGVNNTERVAIDDDSITYKFSGADDANSLILEGSNGSSEKYTFQLQADGGSSAAKFMIGSGGGSASEKMRLDSSGHIQVGQTSTINPGQGNNTFGSALLSSGRLFLSADGTYSLGLNRSDSGELTNFSRAGAFKGSISITASQVNYNQTSDHRLKENVSDMTGAITRLKTLQPKRFNFIADPDDTTVDGFLAHEVTAVPEAVTGTHNATDSDNNPIYQQIDQSKLVPLLTGALQEAIAKIETLETENSTQATQIADLITRVTALEDA
jgi:hypothetical protein